MIILIDGYNLLKNIFPDISFSDQEKAKFIKKLDLFAKNNNHKIIIIFDGGESAYPEKDQIGQVQIIYSGYKSNADELIKHFIEENKGKKLLLISSDRELRKFAKQFKAESIGSEAFYSIIKNEPKAILPDLYYEKAKDKPIKTHKKGSNLDDLMEEASRIILKKKEDLN